jgi:hypothetical protein
VCDPDHTRVIRRKSLIYQSLTPIVPDDPENPPLRGIRDQDRADHVGRGRIIRDHEADRRPVVAVLRWKRQTLCEHASVWADYAARLPSGHTSDVDAAFPLWTVSKRP